MRAAMLDKYNKNGRDLQVCELPVPEPGPGEVLVRVHTAGVNPLDNMITRGEVKLVVPYRFPLVMGNELVGTVEALGSGASRFAVGERVYGRMPLAKIGAFAEYAAVAQTALAKVPDYLSDEEAACVPLTALGAMAVPVAAGMGLIVATNGNGASEERMRTLGASTFIDYRKQDYAEILHDVDFVLDTLGDRELPKEFGVLKQGGTLVSLRGLPNGEFAQRAGLPAWKRIAFGLVGGKYDRMAARRGQNYRFVFVHEDGEGLARIPELMGDRRLEASVDGVFGLDDVNAALAKVAAGGSKGKTVLSVSR